ncbi:ATPase AAA [Candidatus Magnetomorum sp. HK-1]|nr:ATPase AAA [Candidatus Magnetomorum sp. HK-1]
MDYFQLLRLNKEPFSNSPDPAFFYPSKQHAGCLQKLEIAIRLKRGLNVIIGDVGTGKTTLCRHIVRRFSDDSNVQMYLVLDPGFKNSQEFLTEIARLFGLISDDEKIDEWAIKERIKKYLYSEGVDNKKIIAIIIDEGQKIPYFCLELLREFLNYETNEYKLLQIIIFAQQEFKAIINQHANFSDRINICHELGPLGFFDTIRKIKFRLNKASEGRSTPNIFTWPAFWAVYRATGGYPRKILHLCHLVLLALIIQNNTHANYFLVRSCIKRDTSGRYYRSNLIKTFFLACCMCLLLGWGFQQILPENIKQSAFQIYHKLFHASEEVKDYPDMSHSSKEEKINEKIHQHQSSIEEQKNNSEEQKNNSPIILGKIKCLRHESLQDLIRLFYGTFNPWYLRYLKMVNPHIKDTMSIERGQTVHFPGVPVTSSLHKASNRKDLWWIEMAQFKHIHEAYTYFINYPDDAPDILILPYWNKKEGLTFSVLYAIPFQKYADAAKFIDQFPQFLSQTCRIRKEWENETTFFSKKVSDLCY